MSLDQIFGGAWRHLPRVVIQLHPRKVEGRFIRSQNALLSLAETGSGQHAIGRSTKYILTRGGSQSSHQYSGIGRQLTGRGNHDPPFRLSMYLDDCVYPQIWFFVFLNFGDKQPIPDISMLLCFLDTPKYATVRDISHMIAKYNHP